MFKLSVILKAFLLLQASVFYISASTPTPTTLITNASRIVVIADLHADIFRFETILRDANILDIKGKWIAEPNTVVIQLGDQIDPKDVDDIDDRHHFKMIYFTNNLQKMAAANKGQIISLIGNHELYNIDNIKKKQQLREIIASRPVLLQTDKYIFCHGGFKKQHYFLLDIYNNTISGINEIWTKYVCDIPLTLNEEMLLRHLILDTQNSILFTRMPDTKADQDSLFQLVDIDYMFVGHSTSDTVTLKNKVWYLDLYLKDAFDNHGYSYIVIVNDTIRVKPLETYPEQYNVLSIDDYALHI